MNVLQPTALLALLSLPLILILYILRPRHRRLVVPSLRLWQQLPSDLEGRPRWRLPVSSLLLFLQLLIAAAVAVALARPAWPGATRQHLILVVDLSPTMLSVDAAPNRLAAATGYARQALAQLQSDDLVTLISDEPIPRVLASGKGPNAVDPALASLTAAPDQGDLTDALLLASQTARLSEGTHNKILVLSDGTSSDTSLKSLGAIPADVSFQLVGGSDDNRGITELSVRPMIGSVNRYVGFVQVTNYAQQDAKTSFEARADGIVVARQTLTVPARGHVELSLPLPVGTRHFGVAIGAGDVYHNDDSAEVLVPASGPIPVTLVSANPGFWQKAFNTIPSVNLTLVSPTAYKPNAAAITVFDSFVPATMPTGNVVLVAPPLGNTVVPVKGQVPSADIVHTDSSALFASVDLAGIFVPRLDQFGDLPWASSVADSNKGPVILDGNVNGRHMVVLAFDPGTTDWPQRLSFPVFIANLVDVLVAPPIPSDVRAGSVIDLPPAIGANNVLVKLPDGKIDVFTGTGRPVRFTDTGETGTYLVTYANGGSSVAQQEFTVNRLGVAESNVTARVDPTQLSQTGSPTGLPVQHDVWFWVAGGALGLLTIEWLAYFRRHAA
jgi:hypothetical protein